jgi:predicted N-acetyltransferase YhbS
MHSKLTPYTSLPVPDILRLWTQTYGSRYKVDAELLDLNTVQCRDFNHELSRGTGNQGLRAVVLVKNPSTFAGAAPLRAFISGIAFKDHLVGKELLQITLNELAMQGFESVQFGQDVGHFFPGCPDSALKVHAVLESVGFEPRETVFDLERDLIDYVPPLDLKKALEGHSVRWCEPDDRLALLEFLESEFPGRWCHDVLRKAEAESALDFVLGLFAGKVCRGFSVIQKDGADEMPIGGAVWRNDLGPSWGALGPIGIARDLRGRGLGSALLGQALRLLQRLGVRRCIIDWTNLVDFYGAHGFKVERTYRAFRAETSMLPK